MTLKRVLFSDVLPGQRFWSIYDHETGQFTEHVKLIENDEWEFNCVDLSSGRLGVFDDDEVLIKVE